jgi:GxxExxY protein
VGSVLRLDLLVEDEIVLEVKVVEHVQVVHKAQLLSSMRLAKKKKGLLLNFHGAMLTDGVTRCVLR